MRRRYLLRRAPLASAETRPNKQARILLAAAFRAGFCRNKLVFHEWEKEFTHECGSKTGKTRIRPAEPDRGQLTPQPETADTQDMRYRA
ncbi:hypothetical protein J31TS4_25540 [Paenibacillus sp. J31TS4]|nr:hypothetical protein J31TS4_25540 [Paenibacillus sp. J31TS4]